MKNVTLFLFAILITLVGCGQDITNKQSEIIRSGPDITGQWNGVLKVQGTQLRIILNINETDKGYSSTMDSPDQGAKDIPVTSTTFEDSILKIEIPNAGIAYEGTLKEDKVFIGTFKSGGQDFQMVLSQEVIEKELTKKPQEPKKPYPYYSEDVTFLNKKDCVSLAGTLTLPKEEGSFPVVILISGSGPQNRDGELLGHKAFLVVSDYLTKNGIAVLRYDDRGFAKSTGDFSAATSEDFATDVESAVAYLKTRKEIDNKQIGLIGHSEGGIIAPMVAGKSKDVAFVVLLAGPAIPGGELLLLQQKLIGKVSGSSDDEILQNQSKYKKIFEIMNNSNDQEQLNMDLTDYIKQTLVDNPNEKIPEGMSKDDFVKLQVEQITNPWMQYFIKYDPAVALEKVNCPVLAINGGKDLQVPAQVNLKVIKETFEKNGNKQVTIKEIPNLNHLFQECETGSPSEYATIEQTFSPIALTEISDWIWKQVK